MGSNPSSRCSGVLKLLRSFFRCFKKDGRRGRHMTIYYICEYCEQVFSTVETEGQDGSVEVKGICEECAMEMGLLEPTSLGGKQYYN
ncbi:hypothetical protein Swol_0072 [Syntrophomonas wolfei subsp. wolfei str. Goettingen G311]|uniref:Uncharacterized protein n=2 Tax=Syntrophomonas wolfei TaxID=863 RepID=Q0B0S5_SYNWW|nr:hypothetical protein Swol_0072 [Syntrophomonas wolfei subsp. wolfei str. Goettingen G311]